MKPESSKHQFPLQTNDASQRSVQAHSLGQGKPAGRGMQPSQGKEKPAGTSMSPAGGVVVLKATRVT